MGMEKVHINIMFIGHVGSGKTNTADHLIYKLGGIDKSIIERLDKEPHVINKDAWVLDKLKSEHERGITIDKSVIERFEKKSSRGSFKYPWVLDKLKSENEKRGITIDINLSTFETTKYCCTIIDTSVHRDFFLKTMITRTSQLDCVVLIFDSTTSGLVTGMDREARALAHLSFVFGVKRMICCFNKMDATTPKYSEDRYYEIGMTLSPFLEDVGYDPFEVPLVPISGLDGDNLIKHSTNIGWYKGLTLLEALDRIDKPQRPSVKGGRNTVWEKALAVRANIESHCWELQRRNKMRMSEPHLDKKQVRSIVDKIKQVITASSFRKHERAKEGYYTGAEEELKENTEQEEELFNNV